MESRDQIRVEENLDPDDWEAMRALGHKMLDDMLDYLSTARERAVWQPVPEEAKQFLQSDIPQEPQGAGQAYHDFKEYVLPYPMGNFHPRFWGWVMGNGTILGMLSEMLAAGMNPNMGGGEHAANYVEMQVIEWCKQMIDFPEQASGLLVSGGSMANLVGLTVARHAKAGYDIRKKGLHHGERTLTLYASAETHSSVQKAVELLGLGSENLRKIPVLSEYQIDTRALEAAIARDREAGFQPFCVVGSLGTTNTGGLDDLNALADICEKEGLWLHVDGAFGALATLSPELSYLASGLERADSVAFDLHKWMYLPFEVGCVLVRSEKDHRQAFSLTPDYLVHGERGLSAGKIWFSDYGVQLTRGFRALKVWMAIKEHGIRKFGRLIAQNVEQARYLGSLIEAEDTLELLAPVTLNVVCFRYNPGGLNDEQLNELNKELLVRLHESGSAVPSYTTLNGQYTLRVANVNHRTRREDFDLLLREVLRIGQEIQNAL